MLHGRFSIWSPLKSVWPSQYIWSSLSGSLQTRVRCWTPPLHLSEHSLQSDHVDHIGSERIIGSSVFVLLDTEWKYTYVEQWCVIVIIYKFICVISLMTYVTLRLYFFTLQFKTRMIRRVCSGVRGGVAHRPLKKIIIKNREKNETNKQTKPKLRKLTKITKQNIVYKWVKSEEFSKG